MHAATTTLALLLSISGAPPIEARDNYPKFSTGEYIATGTLLAATFLIVYAYPKPKEKIFEGPALFDESVRRALVAETPEGRHRGEQFSDIFLFSSAAYPFVVDVGLLALAVHHDPRVAAQMALVSAQSTLFNIVVQQSVSRMVGRERPSVDECAKDKEYDLDCESDDAYTSFIAGHVSTAFTAAGLVCGQGNAFGLYGRGVGPYIACGSALSVASMLGVMRIIADAHWTTDVLLGVALGLVSGYVLPALLHYGFDNHGAGRLVDNEPSMNSLGLTGVF